MQLHLGQSRLNTPARLLFQVDTDVDSEDLAIVTVRVSNTKGDVMTEAARSFRGLMLDYVPDAAKGAVEAYQWGDSPLAARGSLLHCHKAALTALGAFCRRPA